MTDFIIVGDEAYTAQEWAARLARRERDREYARRPEVRARRSAAFRRWRERNREKYNAYQREWMRRYRARQAAA